METTAAFFREWNNHKQAALSIGLGLLMLLLIYAANALISIDDIVMHIEIAGQGPSAAPSVKLTNSSGFSSTPSSAYRTSSSSSSFLLR